MLVETWPEYLARKQRATTAADKIDTQAAEPPKPAKKAARKKKPATGD